ncbi:MAG: hypothetical protein ACC645_13465, partial [Pirellulales bacterium]
MVPRISVPHVFMLLVLVECLASAAVATAADTGENVELVRAGQARFRLVQNEKQDGRNAAAVADFVRCVRAMTGVAVPTDMAGSRIPFYVGEAAQFAELDIEIPP